MANRKSRTRRKPMDPSAIREERLMALKADERARARDPSRWGEEKLSDERRAAFMAKGVAFAEDFRGRLKHAYKADIFTTLHERGTLSRDEYEAARALQDMMIIRAGLGGRDEADAYERDRTEQSRDPCAVTDRMIDAGRRVDLTLKLIGPPSCRLLMALLDPLAERKDTSRPMRRCTAKTKAGPRCEVLHEADAQVCRACASALPADANGAPIFEALVEPEDWRAVVVRVSDGRITHPIAQSSAILTAAQALVDVRDDVERLLGDQRREREERTEAALAV